MRIPSNPTQKTDRSSRRHALSTGAAVLVGLTACAGLRASIVRAEPRTSVLFEAIGLPVNLTKFEISRANARMVVESDRRFLIVDGEVTNSAAQTLAVPPLKVAIRGADGHVIYTWIAHAPRQKVEPGESAAFSARLASPPTYGADVVVEFDRSQERGVQGSPGGQPRASRQRS